MIFCREATKRMRAGTRFATVIYAHQLRVAIGQCIHDLEIFSKVASDEEAVNRVLFLPL
jgi:hypothetical protein